MNPLKALRQRDADLRGEKARVTRERAAIGDAVIGRAEGERSMTEQERASFLSLGQKADQIDAQIAENAELLQAAEQANEAERNYRVDGEPAAPEARVEVGEDRAAKAPGLFGRQLLAIRKIALAAKGMGEAVTSADMALVKPMQAAATGLNTDIPSDGGFLVAPQRSDTILQRAYQTGEVLSRVSRLPIGQGSNGTTMNAIDETSRADSSRHGGIVSTWVGQGTSVTSGKPKFRQIDLKLRKCMATVYATDEQVKDAVALEGWINKYLPLELQFRAEDAVFNGTGANQPLGILNSGAPVTVTRNTTDRFKYDDAQAMWRRMYAPSRKNAAWFIDQSVETDLDNMHVAIGTGGQLAPTYKPAGSLPGQVYATLYGRPVIPVEYCAALATIGDVILADLSEYVLIDKGGVDQAVSMHVAFLTDEQVFRFIYRVDGQLTWNSALTPKSGSGETVSPVVILSTDT